MWTHSKLQKVQSFFCVANLNEWLPTILMYGDYDQVVIVGFIHIYMGWCNLQLSSIMSNIGTHGLPAWYKYR